MSDKKKLFKTLEMSLFLTLVFLFSVAATVQFKYFLRAIKVTRTQNALFVMRKGIKDFYIKTTLEGNSRFPSYNDIAQTKTPSAIMIDGKLPDNPFDDDGYPNNVVLATNQPKGYIIGDTGGWVYRPTETFPGAKNAGEIWANTSTPGVDENTF